MARFASDTRARMFGEDALWHYKRGAARAALGRTADARDDLDQGDRARRTRLGARAARTSNWPSWR